MDDQHAGSDDNPHAASGDVQQPAQLSGDESDGADSDAKSSNAGDVDEEYDEAEGTTEVTHPRWQDPFLRKNGIYDDLPPLPCVCLFYACNLGVADFTVFCIAFERLIVPLQYSRISFRSKGWWNPR